MTKANWSRPKESVSSYDQCVKAVQTYVATATKAQLICKKDELMEGLEKGQFDNPDAIRFARKVIGMIETEIVMRFEIAVRRRNRKRA